MLKYLASLTLILTFCLMLLGGVVHSTGSSLACPDWPLCYGQVMPEMTGGVAIEHSHRLLGATVGFFTLLTLIAAWRKSYQDRLVKRLSLVAFCLVVFQGGLGGLTVIYKLPTAISTAHLSTAMIFFSTMLWITLRATFRVGTGSPRPQVKGGVTPPLLCVAAVAVYLQIVLGALVRHTGAGIVCPDIPFCLGQAWPLDLHPATRLHMLHRYAGVAVAVLVCWAAVTTLRQVMDSAVIRNLAVVAIVLVCFQIFLGIVSVQTSLATAMITAHLGTAALILASLLTLIYFRSDSAIT